MNPDLVIRNGVVVDGTGAKATVADVAIENDRIAHVGAVPDSCDAPSVDASGKIVAPGFIDIHSHSDYTLLADPRAVSAVHQGVTLEVVGNCGYGCFPLHNKQLATKAVYGYTGDVELDWSSAAEYFDRVDRACPAVNVISLVPNGQLRLSVMGSVDRPATREETNSMRLLLETSIEQGAWGYSTGLEYAAERGAGRDELTDLARACGRRNGLYATHTRQRDAGSEDAVSEAIDVGTDADVRLQISHLIPRNGLDAGRECIRRVENAAGCGDIDIAFDMHTRLYGTTFLQTVFPPYALEADSAELRRLLADSVVRREFRKYVSILSASGDWSRVVLLDNDVWPQYARRSIADIAVERGQDAFDTVHDLLAAVTDDPSRLMVIINCHDEQQQREAFTHPLSMPGSDATTLAPDGPLAHSVFHGAYTWASWFHRYFATETRLLSTEEVVHRLTGAPAQRLGLLDRGVLRPGAFADLAIFDPDRFGERATTFEPNIVAEGMDTVVVNGVVTLAGGRPTGDRGGRALRYQ